MKRDRGRMFISTIGTTCRGRRILLHRVTLSEIRELGGPSGGNKWDVAMRVANRFSELKGRLPARRLPWQSEDDRMGIFMAAACVLMAWSKLFRAN